MLRINLLPSYVTQRRLTKRLIPVFALLVLLSVALPLLLFGSMKAHLTELTQQAETEEQKKTANDALDALAASTLAKVQPIQDKVNFVEAVHKHIRDQVKTIYTVASESPKKSFIYSGMAPGAGYSSMTINAYSPSVAEAGRYLEAMYQQPVISSIAVDKIPGYPDNVQHRWYLGPIKPQYMVFADGASASGGAMAGGGGYPGGGGGGYPGGGGGGGTAASAPGGFNASNLGPNGPNNVPPGVGPPPPELTGGLLTTGGGGGGGYPGGGGGGYPGGGGGAQAGGGGYSANFLRIALAGVSPFATPDVIARILRTKMRQVRMVTIPKGFNVTVSATIAPPYAPLAAPAPPGSAPAGGAAGGFPGGAPGGYPGAGGGYPGAGGGYPGGGYPGGGRAAQTSG